MRDRLLRTTQLLLVSSTTANESATPKWLVSNEDWVRVTLRQGRPRRPYRKPTVKFYRTAGLATTLTRVVLLDDLFKWGAFGWVSYPRWTSWSNESAAIQPLIITIGIPGPG
ncbi:hypothetical protein EC9_36050 [Rosistilla ulvae]|uniref:Uncharacterized protein n=1 Tax=Rosistilla ulvae TaxID=1930277 RepID=A0A517M3F8_9BACT|nr:hypothetical protein EC9_36050 [Rosistilla ulvae]